MPEPARARPADPPAADQGDRRPVYRWQPKTPPIWADLWAGGKRARRWRRYWIRDVVEGLGDLAFTTAFRFGPVDACSDLGAYFGRRAGGGAHVEATERARTARRKLAAPMAEAEEHAWLSAMWTNIGRTYAEFAVLHRIVGERCTLHGADLLDAAAADGRPVILALVHLGNWEAAIAAAARHVASAQRQPLHLIYQPPLNRFRHWVARQARGRVGITLLPPGTRGTRPALEVLARGGVLVLAVDEGFDNYVYGPFLGRAPVLRGNMQTLVRLAWRTGARVLPLYGLRRDGARFDIRIGQPIALFEGSQARNTPLVPERALAAVQRLDAVFSPLVITNLQQWYMLPQFGLRPDDVFALSA